MEIKTAETALRRAAKAFRHATRALAEAESESARKRHARRAMNAQRRLAEGRRNFEALALIGAD
jgi:hypothetical protein